MMTHGALIDFHQRLWFVVTEWDATRRGRNYGLGYAAHDALTPFRKTSMTTSAIGSSLYLRFEMIQLVAISSRAPKRIFETNFAFRSLRKTPVRWPSSKVLRNKPRYSAKPAAENSRMNLVEPRNSTWNTTARSRSAPRRSR